MVKIDNLSFAYPLKHVLKSVSFTLEEGKSIALLGRNGCGKSTLLKLMLALLSPDGGTITVNGKDLYAMKDRERASYIAYIPQYSADTFPSKVIDSVVMGKAASLSLFEKPSKKDYEEAERVLDYLGIENLKSRSTEKLSGGERQLVLIARALMQKAKILLLDEPTASLDYSNQIMVMETVNKLTKEGYSALFSTHNPEQALMYADSILILDDGASEFVDNPESLLYSSRLSELYGRELYLSVIDTGSNRRIVCLPK